MITLKVIVPVCTFVYHCIFSETANLAQVHEIKEDWKPSFLTNDEFMHLMLEVRRVYLTLYTCTEEFTLLYIHGLRSLPYFIYMY